MVMQYQAKSCGSHPPESRVPTAVTQGGRVKIAMCPCRLMVVDVRAIYVSLVRAESDRDWVLACYKVAQATMLPSD